MVGAMKTNTAARWRCARLVLVALMIVGSPSTRGETQPRTFEDGVVRIQVEGADALYSAVNELGRLSPVPITFEAPPWAYAGDLIAPAAASRTPGSLTMGRPRSASITLERAVDDMTAEVVMSMLEEIVRSYEQQGTSARFRVERSGMIHVIPTMVKNRDGVQVPVTPVMDTPITLPAGERTALEWVTAILAEISRTAGVQVNLAQAPFNTLQRTRVRLAAEREPARVVIQRLMSLMHREIYWRLSYDLNGPRYWMVLSGMPPVRPQQ